MLAMDEKAFDLMHYLGSGACRQILACLEEGLDHPDDISRALGVVRQTVDWHLLKLSGLGIVERIPQASASGRPRIIYRLGQEAADLIRQVEGLMEAHVARVRQRLDARQRELDVKLAMGEMSERAYKEAVGRLKRERNALGI